MTEEAPTEPRLEHRLVVLMFTDLLNSSGLKVQFGDLDYAAKVAKPHNELFRATLARFAGAREINYTGDGFLASFRNVADAVETALLFHHALRTHAWQAVPVQTRIGIHLGECVILADTDDAGMTIASHAADMCARLMSLGTGGQTLLTRHAFDDARQYVRAHPALPEGGESPALEWAAHGPYLFKGKDEPLEVFEVGAVGIAPLTPPPDAEKARRAVRPGEEETLGWRPAQGVEVPGRPGWQVVRKLGEGGFGEVWLAEQGKMKQHRVFKFCFDEERLRSFKRELTFFRLIRDALGERDDIARLYDVKLDAPPFFLESEFAEHGNLVEWCERQGGVAAVPISRRLDILARVAEAVAAAHSIGILHKDIKPQNVLMQARSGGEETPQLADFGIGALADRGALAAHQITAAGFTVMTLPPAKGSSNSMTRLYAPPEQLSGKLYTVQGDIYALGVVLYQLIVGDFTRALAPGWERDITEELLREDLAACVDGEPARRLPSAAELATRLRTLEERRAARERSQHQAERNVRRRRLARLSLGAAVLAVLVAVGLGAGFFRERDLRQRVVAAEERRVAGERQRLADRKQFAPALVEAARFLIARRDFDSARVSVEQAVEYDPVLASALGLKAALLAEREDFAGAAAVLANPACEDATLIKLGGLCRGARADHRPDAKAMGDVFQTLGLHVLAESYFTRAGARIEAALAKIEAAWPKAAAAAKVLSSGNLRVDLSNRSDVVDLMPLSGLPIEEISLSGTKVTSLMPLHGMMLREIDLSDTRVRDLAPLRGMPLTRVRASGVPVRDLAPLSDAPLAELNVPGSEVTNLAPLRNTPLKILVINSCRIVTLESLRGKSLTFFSAPRTGISSLDPLVGMPLTGLNIGDNPVHDLGPLAGMKLTNLIVCGCRVRDISVVRGMPLKALDISRTEVVDVSPLAEAPLADGLTFFPDIVQTGMDQLRANPRIKGFRVRSAEMMVPDEFWKRYDARYFDAY